MTARDVNSVTPHTLAEVTAERDRLRAAIGEAVTELRSTSEWMTVVARDGENSICRSVTHKVADDLAQAQRGDGR